VQQPTSCGLLCERHVYHASAVMAAEANFSRKLSHCVMCTHAWGAVTDQIRRVRSASRNLRISKHEELYARVLPLHNGRSRLSRVRKATRQRLTEIPQNARMHWQGQAHACMTGALSRFHCAELCSAMYTQPASQPHGSSTSTAVQRSVVPPS